MKRSILLLLPVFSILSCSLFAQSPGAVKGLSFGLQGDFSPGKAGPGTLNFNPATLLGNATSPVQLPADIESLRRATIFTVYQNAAATEEIPVWEMTGDFGDIALTSNQVISKSRKTNLPFATDKAVSRNTGSSETILHTYRASWGKGTAENAGKEGIVRFGGAASSASLVAEFLLYERILSEEEVTRVESYLALKYGITLQKNYVNTLGKTVWDWKSDKTYSHNIAGIARDDQSTLRQKQGCSANLPGELVIGISSIETLSSRNNGSIGNRDYLVWGDNAGSNTWNQYVKSSAGEITMPERKWLMKASGNSPGSIATALKIDTKTLLTSTFSKENFCLIIDRSGNGDFSADHCTYIFPDVISEDGIASFSGVHWDTDGSGKDVFTFGLRTLPPPAVLVNGKTTDDQDVAIQSFLLYPNPVTDGRYSISVTMGKPTDVQVQIYDGYQHLVESVKGSGKHSYFFSGRLNVPAGSYTVRLIMPGKEITKMLIVQ